MNILYINSTTFDYTTSTLIEGLNELGHQVLCSEASNYGRKLPDEQIADFAETADVIAIGTNLGVRTHLLKTVRNPRRVFVDGIDYQPPTIVDELRVKLIFKRELNRRDYEAESRFTFPFPFAAEKRYFTSNMPDKDILLTFLANMQSNPWRYSVHQRLLNQRNPGIVSGTTNERAYSVVHAQPTPIDTPSYRALLQRSLISVNVAGSGYDCARFWEILAAKAMLFTQEPDIVIPNGFTDGLDCVTFRSLEEFDEKLIYYLNRLDLVKQIAERGYQRLLKYHTTQVRAAYFIDLVQRHIHREGYC